MGLEVESQRGFENCDFGTVCGVQRQWSYLPGKCIEI